MAEDDDPSPAETAAMMNALSSTQEIKRPNGWEPRTRRARSNVDVPRANTMPAIPPGGEELRIVPDVKTIRKWAQGRGYDVSGKGPVPGGVRDAFTAFMSVNGNGSWRVMVVRGKARLPSGKMVPLSFYKVKQGPFSKVETTDRFYVERAMGAELYGLLQRVRGPEKDRRKKNK